MGSNFIPPPFIDVNGDSNVSPIDVLLVINYLNARANGEGEVSGAPLVVTGNSAVVGSGQASSSSGNQNESSGLTGSGEAYSENFCFAVDTKSKPDAANFSEIGGFPGSIGIESDKKRAETDLEDEQIVELINLLTQNHFV